MPGCSRTRSSACPLGGAPRSAGTSDRWANSSTSILQRYHAGIREEVAGLVALAEKVERVHAGKPSCLRGLTSHLAQVYRALEIHLG